MNEIKEIPVEAIVVSATNPRKHFDAAEAKELTDSVRERGIFQPLLVRARAGDIRVCKAVTLPGDGKKVWGLTKGDVGASHIVVTGLTKKEAEEQLSRYTAAGFELIAGERRLRAAKEAGLGSVPAIVLDVTDQEALEIQIIENAQRTNLHPMEEAEGYERLQKTYRVTVEDLAAKTGKSVASIYGRLKLLDCCEKVRQALFADEINASVALLIARLGTAALQEKALDRARATQYDRAMSTREAAKMIHDEFMLVLKEAPFDVADAELNPAVGACLECPMRTGNQPDLFGDLDKRDSCLNPDCFKTKVRLYGQRRLAAAREEGRPVLVGKEAKAIVSSSGFVAGGSGFVSLSENQYICQGKAYGQTWAKALGKDKPEITLCEGENGEVLELARRDEVMEKLKAAGKLEERHQADHDADDDWKKQERDRAKKKKLLDQVARDATTKVLAKLEKHLSAAATSPVAFWRALAIGLDHHNDIDTTAFVARRRGLAQTMTEVRDAVKAWIAKESDPVELFGFMVESLCLVRWNESYDPKIGKPFHEFCEFAGVDSRAMEKNALAEAKQAARAEKKKKAKGAKAAAKDSEPSPNPAAGNLCCEVCGCTTMQACQTETGPCHWIRKPTATRKGLCSACAPVPKKKRK